MAAAHKRVQPHRSRTLREPTTVFTGACRRVVAVLPSWAWLREPAGRTGVAAFASGDTLDRTPYGQKALVLHHDGLPGANIRKTQQPPPSPPGHDPYIEIPLRPAALTSSSAASPELRSPPHRGTPHSEDATDTPPQPGRASGLCTIPTDAAAAARLCNQSAPVPSSPSPSPAVGGGSAKEGPHARAQL